MNSALPVSLDLAPAETAVPGWAQRVGLWGARVGLRFLCVYLVLYNLPFVLSYTLRLAFGFQGGSVALLGWLGAHVLHLNHPITRSLYGSGDTVYDYVQVAAFAAFAAVIAPFWAWKDAQRKLALLWPDWLLILLRYRLGITMIAYGFDKVIPLQFPAPTLIRLTERVGDMSPMGILWTFMGTSPFYGAFGGLAEVVGGLLVFFRPTKTLGALVLLGVMVNVLMLNLCFDVPVKLFASHLLLMSLILIAPDAWRLAQVLVLNQTVERRILPPPFRSRKLHLARYTLKPLLIAVLVATTINANLARSAQALAAKPLVPFGGAYDVMHLSLGDRQDAALLPSERWRRVWFDDTGKMWVRHGDSSKMYFSARIDTTRQTITLIDKFGLEIRGQLAYHLPTPNTLTFAGTVVGAAFEASMQVPEETRRDQFLLFNRGFHWLNEHPFNR
jgi:hypothetical protein